MEGIKFVKDVPSMLNGKPIWEVGRAYAMTECNYKFISPRISKANIEFLSKARKNQSHERDKSRSIPKAENLEELLSKLK